MTARRLDIGSGYQPWRTDDPTWEHLDISPGATHVEWRLNAFEPLPFADGTFDEIRAVDVLEHTSWQTTEQTLREWVRVLAPGGLLHVQVPDAEQVMVRYCSDPQSLRVAHLADAPPIVWAAWRIMGGHHDQQFARTGDDWRWNAHYAMFSEASLIDYLGRAGVVVERVWRNGFPNLFADSRRPL